VPLEYLKGLANYWAEEFEASGEPRVERTPRTAGFGGQEQSGSALLLVVRGERGERDSRDARNRARATSWRALLVPAIERSGGSAGILPALSLTLVHMVLVATALARPAFTRGRLGQA
jgi:hypothetical protein